MPGTTSGNPRRRRHALSGLLAQEEGHQYDLVHAHGDYDLEWDATTASPRECAQRIKKLLPHRPNPTAFTRLRRRHLPGGPADVDATGHR